MNEVLASTVEELVNATDNLAVEVIRVKGKIKESPSLHLSPGQQLIGDGDSTIEFKEGIDGLTVIVESNRRAILNRSECGSNRSRY